MTIDRGFGGGDGDVAYGLWTMEVMLLVPVDVFLAVIVMNVIITSTLNPKPLNLKALKP